MTSEEELENARRQIGELDLSSAWEVEVKPFAFNRSTQQNKKYWALIGELGSFLGYDEGEMHELMKYKFLSYKQEMLGDEMVVIPSTSKLTIKEFVTTYLSRKVCSRVRIYIRFTQYGLLRENMTHIKR